MSIVLDALNKAERDRQRSSLDPETKKDVMRMAIGYKRKIKFFILLNLIIIVLVTGVNYLFWKKNEKTESKTEVPASVPPVESKPVQPEVKEVPEEKPVSLPSEPSSPEIYKNHFSIPGEITIEISGVFFDGKETYVLVGDDAFKTGDKIQKKALIQEITLDNVIIQYKGKNYEIPT